jgi:DNA-directed RNA polymerase specialized sigma24 family protein
MDRDESWMMPSSNSRWPAREHAPGRTLSAPGSSHDVQRSGTAGSAAQLPRNVLTGPWSESARRTHWQADGSGDVLKDALTQLSDRHRAMIYKSCYLGRTTTQIAAELRTNDEMVKNELHHALHALRAALRVGENITPMPRR